MATRKQPSGRGPSDKRPQQARSSSGALVRAPRRSVERQENALKILFALIRAQQRMPHNASAAPLNATDDKITLNKEAMRQALDDIMACFGYAVTPIQ
mgnify:FL=1